MRPFPCLHVREVHMYPIIFIDTETTGLDPATAAVIEVAMIRREAD